MIRSTISAFLFELVLLFQILSSSKYPRSGTIKSVHIPLLELYELTFFSFNQTNYGLKIKSEMSTHLKISQIKLSMYIFISTHNSTALLDSSRFMITSPSSPITPQPCQKTLQFKMSHRRPGLYLQNPSSTLTGGTCGVSIHVLPSDLGQIAL